MRVDPQAILEAGEADWALGELLHLISRGKRVGIMAHELDPALFHACMRVLNWQPFEVRHSAQLAIAGMEPFRLLRVGQRSVPEKVK